MTKRRVIWVVSGAIAVLALVLWFVFRQHQVQFVLSDGTQVQSVRHGRLPTVPEAADEELELLYWLDEQGDRADPHSDAVTGAVTYKAVYRPLLTEHGPYLFLDAEYCLYPDAPLTADALSRALTALASARAQAYFPELPKGDAPLSGQMLTSVLVQFFPNAPAFEGAAVTRAEFAGALHGLLGRQNGEKVLLTEDSLLPKDLELGRADLEILLESCVPHSPDEAGTVWQHADVKTVYPQGLLNLQGYLYYVQEDGTFLRNEQLGRLFFGENGRYTCGDGELDTIVAEYLAQIMEENPSANRLELLKIAYDYCHRTFQYLKRNLYTVGQTGWEVEDAKIMFSSGRGNCYNFAAAFWAIARGLGYEARAISGTCTSTRQPHGWVIIEIDGKDYFFDPEWQYAYRTNGVAGKNMFMIPKDRTWFWAYKWKE